MYDNSGIDASNFVSSFNIAFYFIVGISLVFLIGLTFLMLYFVYKYNRKRNKVATQIEGNMKLEILWTVIPIILSLAMFHYGWIGWTPMTKAPDDAMEVTSIARMWNFTFRYENGRESPDLVLPVNKPVKIQLVSVDVLHSLFIPAFRVKSDMIPGMDKMMWFVPQREGEYDLYCAEYCGLQHSSMTAIVRVLPEAEFLKWYADTTKVIGVSDEAVPGSEGLAILRSQGCNACHSSDGSRILGPSYRNLFGETQTVTRDGKEVTVTVDEEYIRRAIYDPDADIPQGYPRGLMQSYKGIISEEDIEKIIEYMKILNENPN
jgi:cytochrome c oxidase subunit II